MGAGFSPRRAGRCLTARGKRSPFPPGQRRCEIGRPPGTRAGRAGQGGWQAGAPRDGALSRRQGLRRPDGPGARQRGSPIAGAHVRVWAPGGSRAADALRHRATTDPQGRYRLRDIPHRAIDGTPMPVRLTATRDGFAGTDSPLLTLTESGPEKPQIVEPIRLERGVSLRGQVLDHRGQPVAGAMIRTNQPLLQGGSGGTTLTVQAGKDGRFVVDGVRRGVVQLFAFHGRSLKSNLYLADGSPEVIRIRLADPAAGPAPNLAALRAASRADRRGPARAGVASGALVGWPGSHARRLSRQGRGPVFLGDQLRARRRCITGHGPARVSLPAPRRGIPGDPQSRAGRGPRP